ncbi:hypothetical protein [Xanthomonas theicola]|uniref:hypothetical protein n=1 Tax=Xanthomonas theicola TaxID=56464 RepID=UPI001FE59279|nr:hypothetical protein [Xanthomonas theicola]
MSACIRNVLLAAVLFFAWIGSASAAAWVQLVGPPSNAYQAPAAFDLGVRWGVTTTGPKAEYLDNLRLLRNGTVVTMQAGGVYREVGLSPGAYTYELRADAVRNLPDGDQTRRSLVSAVGPITVNAPPAPFDGAEFVSLQIPGPLQHRTSYTFSATVRNAGNTTWPAGDDYQLAMAHDGNARAWSFSNVSAPHAVAPGQTATFTFNVVSPPPGENGRCTAMAPAGSAQLPSWPRDGWTGRSTRRISSTRSSPTGWRRARPTTSRCACEMRATPPGHRLPGTHWAH